MKKTLICSLAIALVSIMTGCASESGPEEQTGGDDASKEMPTPAVETDGVKEQDSCFTVCTHWDKKAGADGCLPWCCSSSGACRPMG